MTVILPSAAPSDELVPVVLPNLARAGFFTTVAQLASMPSVDVTTSELSTSKNYEEAILK